jgi:hypothetical protein
MPVVRLPEKPAGVGKYHLIRCEGYIPKSPFVAGLLIPEAFPKFAQVLGKALLQDIALRSQGIGVYFLIVLIVKISLNVQKFSIKLNTKATKAHQGGKKLHCIPSVCALVFSNRRFVEPEVRLWFKILQSFGKFQPLETNRRCPACVLFPP